MYPLFNGQQGGEEACFIKHFFTCFGSMGSKEEKKLVSHPLFFQMVEAEFPISDSTFFYYLCPKRKGIGIYSVPFCPAITTVVE